MARPFEVSTTLGLCKGTLWPLRDLLGICNGSIRIGFMFKGSIGATIGDLTIVVGP